MGDRAEHDAIGGKFKSIVVRIQICCIVVVSL